MSGSRWTVGVGDVVDWDRRAREVRSALEWAQVRALAGDGISEREIARRLGINRRTVRRLAGADELPRYERAGKGSMLDPLEAACKGEKAQMGTNTFMLTHPASSASTATNACVAKRDGRAATDVKNAAKQ